MIFEEVKKIHDENEEQIEEYMKKLNLFNCVYFQKNINYKYIE